MTLCLPKFHFSACYNQNMNKEEIRFHLRDRWKAVEEIEREELRAMSMETRLQKMGMIWGLGKSLGFSFEPDESELEVFERWVKIKDKEGK